jgi:hypothetical protein
MFSSKKEHPAVDVRYQVRPKTSVSVDASTVVETPRRGASFDDWMKRRGTLEFFSDLFEEAGKYRRK